RDKIFIAAMGTPLAVLGLFFGGLLLSLAGSTSVSRFCSILVSREILFAVRLSVFTATISTLAAMLIALPAAYALSRLQFRGKTVVDTLIDLPIVLSPIALGAALLVFSTTPPGRFIEGNVLGFVFEVPGLVLAQFTVVVALATKLLKSTFDMVDTRYVAVGRVMGCTAFQAFRKVTLPLARPGVLAALILTWARAIGEYGASVTLAGATSMKTSTLPIEINLSFATANVERAVAVILVLAMIAGAALLALRLVGGRSVA
ncbi:MAG: ABC transporter permease subunit, partial [Planctomycetota bacterium]|nr:ABC transporter permease subunit [Planctomycetota bacterium]